MMSSMQELRGPRIARNRLDLTRSVGRLARRLRRLAQQLDAAAPVVDTADGDRRWALALADNLDDLCQRMDVAHPRGRS